MKRLLFTLFATCAAFFTATAQTPGYAIFGETPDGYTPLQSAVNIVGAGSYSDKFVVEDGVLKITGNTSLSTSRVCSDETNNIRLQFTAAQTLTWTSDFAIHIKLKKGSSNSNANLHFALCRDSWNSKRLGYFISQSEISDSEETEIVLKLGDRATSDWSSANDNQMYGTNMSFSANDIVRFQAQTNDYFEISQIYIEAEYVAPIVPQAPKRYYFVRGGELPVIDGVECVDLRATTYSAWSANPGSAAPNLSGDYAAFTLPNQWFAADLKPKAQCMADVRKADWYLRMKFKTDASSLAGQNLRINLSNGANNFHLINDYGDGEWHDITFALADAANTLRTFPVSANDIAFQLHANGSLNGTYFDIEYAYLTNDPTTDEKPAIVDNVPPTNFSVTEKAGATTHNKATLQLYAEDEDTPITYTIHYTVKNSGVAPTEVIVNGAQGTTVEKEISGLLPETTYSFSVVASDPNGNETTATEIDITTTTLVETRYYLFRGDPASVSLPSVGVISYDLREGVGSTVGNGGGFTHSQKKYYTAFVNGGGWWSFNQNLSSAKDMSEISQADWYLVVKFRTTISYGNFNIRLNNAVSYQNGQNLTYESDGTWNVLTLALADAKNTLTYGASQSGTIFQFHADGGAGYLDIAYAYLTNNAANVDDLADNVAPVISSLTDGDKTTSSIVLTVTASEDSGEDITYIVKEGTTVLTSTPATGASGAATAITVSELVGQDHTLTVIARDGAGNEASQNIAVSLPAAVAPPSNLAVATTNTDKSVTFTMSADDDNASLVYAILDGSDNVLVDNIPGTAGGETAYTLHGLTPETAYSFKVRVTNAASLSATSDAINVTTNALSEHRFYITRGNNTDPLPESSNLTSNYLDCNLEFGNADRDNRASDYISAKTGNTWIAITFKPKATVANEIDDNWYIVVRFRSNLSNNVFGFNNFRLNLNNNAQNWYINNSDSDKPFGRDYNDGNWIVIKKRIGDRRAGSALPASYLQAGQVAAQLHVNANLIAGEFLDVDYVYFTDDITSIDEGTQHNAKIMLKDNADNSDVLDAHDGQTLDVDLTRSLVNASYNTLCLPFSMSTAQIEEHFGAEAKVARLSGAAIEGDELILGFAFVNEIQAGVPYIIQPEANVSNPLIHNVTIANTETPAVFGDVRFIGVFNPTEIEQQSAAEHSILLLGANNQLSWPNTTANLKGTRAYFRTSSTVTRVVRRARMGFDAAEVATGLDEISNTRSQTTRKVLINNQLYIIRDGEVYNVTGGRVK